MDLAVNELKLVISRNGSLPEPHYELSRALYYRDLSLTTSDNLGEGHRGGSKGGCSVAGLCRRSHPSRRNVVPKWPVPKELLRNIRRSLPASKTMLNPTVKSAPPWTSPGDHEGAVTELKKSRSPRQQRRRVLQQFGSRARANIQGGIARRPGMFLRGREFMRVETDLCQRDRRVKLRRTTVLLSAWTMRGTALWRRS